MRAVPESVGNERNRKASASSSGHAAAAMAIFSLAATWAGDPARCTPWPNAPLRRVSVATGVAAGAVAARASHGCVACHRRHGRCRAHLGISGTAGSWLPAGGGDVGERIDVQRVVVG
jgi:hypothetical protein